MAALLSTVKKLIVEDWRSASLEREVAVAKSGPSPLSLLAFLFGETAGWLVETRRRHAHRCVENTGSWPSSCWETGRDYLNCPGRKDH